MLRRRREEGRKLGSIWNKKAAGTRHFHAKKWKPLLYSLISRHQHEQTNPFVTQRLIAPPQNKWTKRNPFPRLGLIVLPQTLQLLQIHKWTTGNPQQHLPLWPETGRVDVTHFLDKKSRHGNLMHGE